MHHGRCRARNHSSSSSLSSLSPYSFSPASSMVIHWINLWSGIDKTGYSGSWTLSISTEGTQEHKLIDLLWFTISEAPSVHNIGECVVETNSSPHGGQEEERQNTCTCRLSPLFPIVLSGLPNYKVLATNREGFLHLANSLWQSLTDTKKVCFTNLLGVFNPIKLTIKTNTGLERCFSVLSAYCVS